MQNKVSLPVIRRLPRYYRYVEEMIARGIERVSSSELADLMGSTASQVRQDFNCFGGFGQQGVGYNTSVLYEKLKELIFQDAILPAILIGVGSLGHTIARYISQECFGVSLVAAFDIQEDLFGEKVENVDIYSMDFLESFCREHNPQIAVICVPKEAAQQMAERIIKLNLNGIWNFTHCDFSLYDDNLIVENVYLQDSMMSLQFRINNIDLGE